MPSLKTLSLAAFVCIAAAQDTTSATTATSSAPAPTSTDVVLLPATVEGCHPHAGTEIYCFAGDDEWEITSENAADYDGQDLTGCMPGDETDEITCNSEDGTAVTLVRGGDDHDEESHSEEDHDHDHSHSEGVPSEVDECHAHGGEEIYCFAGDEEWEITSDNAANYEGQTLTNCEADASNTTITCTSENNTEVTLAQEAGNTTHDDEVEDADSAASALMASVGFSVAGLFIAVFAL